MLVLLLNVRGSSLIIIGRNNLEKVVNLNEDEHIITLILHRHEKFDL